MRMYTKVYTCNEIDLLLLFIMQHRCIRQLDLPSELENTIESEMFLF